MTTHHPKTRDAALGMLADFFATADADQGMRSSWGPLADIAQGGFGGGGDYERKIKDGRFGLGPAGRGSVTRAREVRSVLQALPPHMVAVLYAKHSLTPWTRIIDAAFGTGMSIKVTKRMGDLAAVALLTDEVRTGYEGAEAKPKQRNPAWSNPGGWLVALCIDKSDSAKQRAERVKTAARRLLSEAEAAYLAASGVVPEDPTKPTPRRIRRHLYPIDAPLNMHEAP